MNHTHFAFSFLRTLSRGLLVALLATLIITPLPLRHKAQAASDHSLLITASPMQSGTTLNEYPIPTANSGASNITVGLDGNFWFTETAGNKIGQVTTAGGFTEFPLPTANSQPFGIASGPDQRIWFTEQGANKIGAITLDGTVTDYSLPTASSKPTGIAQGSDGALWFTENTANKIGRITTSGAVSEFAIPTANSGPLFITQGPDGNMWFTENTASKVGRITSAGAISEFAMPNSGPEGITAAFDGNLWVTCPNADQIASITTGGTISPVPLFTGTRPKGIAAGTNGSIYAALSGPHQVLKHTPPAGFSDTQVGGDITGLTFLEDKSKSAGIIAGVETQTNKTVIFQDNNFASQIEFTKTLANPPIEVGSDAIYDIRVKNNSGNTLNGCEIFDIVEASSGSLTPLVFDDQEGWSGYTEASGRASYAITKPGFSLAPFEEKQFTIIPLARAAGSATNEAQFLYSDKIYVKAFVTHDIKPASVFSFSTPQVSQPVAAGQTASFTVNLNPPQPPGQQALNVKPEATNVNLSAKVFPATDTITASFSPNPAPAPGSTTLNVNTTSSTPAGTYTITIAGTAGAVTHNAVVKLTVTQGQDFTLGFDQPTITKQAGSGKATVHVKIIRTGGFTGSVTVTPPPKGNGIKPKPPDPKTTTDDSVTFKFKVGSAAPGQYPLVFTAQDSTGRTRTGTVTLNLVQ